VSAFLTGVSTIPAEASTLQL